MDRTLPHLPHPASDEAPKYWVHETGGELAPAMLHFLDRQELTIREVSLIRAYLLQWVESPAWDRNPFMEPGGRFSLSLLRTNVRQAKTQTELDRCVRMAVDLGMDPL